MDQDRTIVRSCDSLPGEGGLTLHRPAALVTNESQTLPVEGSRPVATRTTEVTPDGSDRESGEGTTAEGLRSTFAPPDAEPHGTGGNRRGPQVTAEAVGKLFVHVVGGNRDHEAMRGDRRGAAAATCKIAGIAYTGSNPVPATLLLSCENAVAYRPITPGSTLRFPSGFPPPDAPPTPTAHPALPGRTRPRSARPPGDAVWGSWWM
jgi:hypothetical protein